MAADMEVDKVAGHMADMVADKAADKKDWYPILSRGCIWVNWVKTFSTRSLSDLRVF